jgi:indole-3-glycerol phosphate synthase
MAFDLLTRIVEWTKGDVERRRAEIPFSEIEARAKAMPAAIDFAGALGQQGFGLIAEIKVKSPSMGMMRQDNVEEAPAVYSSHPLVRAVSVLTSQKYFGMGTQDLWRLRKKISKPILCKDFIVDEYQVAEARSVGADAILLMSHVLKDQGRIADLLAYCRELGMEALIETRNADEIKSIPSDAKVVGINSRKIDTSRYSLRYALSRLFKHDLSPVKSRFDQFDLLPRDAIKVAESGISTATINGVRNQGWNAALIGTSILLDQRGAKACLDDMQAALNQSVIKEQPAVTLRTRFASFL